MKKKTRYVAREIIDGFKEMTLALEAGIPLHEKFIVRTVHVVPDPGQYDAASVK